MRSIAALAVLLFAGLAIAGPYFPTQMLDIRGKDAAAQKIKEIDATQVPESEALKATLYGSLKTERDRLYATKETLNLKEATAELDAFGVWATTLYSTLAPNGAVVSETDFLAKVKTLSPARDFLKLADFFPSGDKNLDLLYEASYLVPSNDQVTGENYARASRFLHTTTIDQLKATIESVRASITDASTALDDLIKAYDQKIAAVTAPSPTQRVADNLLWYIVVIALTALGVLFFVSKWFDPQIQQELISSGQLVQLLTIITLLSILAALGMSKNLGENSLGTLLGGIGGYVLSQGIGRAAANSAAQATAQMIRGTGDGGQGGDGPGGKPQDRNAGGSGKNKVDEIRTGVPASDVDVINPNLSGPQEDIANADPKSGQSGGTDADKK